jgi:hypothetical protein
MHCLASFSATLSIGTRNFDATIEVARISTRPHHHPHPPQVVLDCNDANVGFYEKVPPLPPPPPLSRPSLTPAQIGFARKENQMARYFK